MKKIINGKLYNTDTARLVGTYDASIDNQFFGWYESLYIKRTGEYFIYGESANGPVRSSSTAEKFFPLSYGEARSWAESRLPEDVYETEFGTVQDGGTSTPLHLYLSTAAAERARREAAKSGIMVSAYIESLINAACANKGE